MSDYNVLVSLRVLYTVNTSPQYILAKSSEKIAVNPITGGSSSNTAPRHGRTSVRACAMAICRSSPELNPDSMKDYSLYILDPLEDLISKSRHGQSGGVAVGMGLMSTILAIPMKESPSVTGTFVASGGEDDALEVVISLRQVTPPPSVTSVQSLQRNSTLPSESSVKCEPPRQFLASTPPLPSFDERLLASSSRRSKSSNSNKPVNPSHFTRAHLMPTPYIGPPKAPRKRKADSDIFQSSEPWTYNTFSRSCTPQGEVKVESETDDSTLLEPPSSSQNTSRSRSTPDDGPMASVPPHPPQGNPSTDLSQSAVILAALSSVGSQKPSADGKTDAPSVAPNPELVDFFKAYLQFVKIQKESAPTTEKTTDSLLSSRATETTSANPDQTQASAFDKENVRPGPTTYSKESTSKPKSTTSPLGSSRYNSRLSSDGTTLASSKSVNHVLSLPSSSSSSLPAKRKIGEVTLSSQDHELKRQTSTSSIQLKPAEARVNTGWGGLRRMADGSIWNGHSTTSTKVVVASTKSGSGKPFVFRQPGSSKTVVDVPVRKGPFVVPDWAKNCPAPAPPPRSEDASTSKEDKKSTKSRKAKSKGLERLGSGKGPMKRDRIPSGSKENIPNPKTPPRRLSGPFSAANDQGSFKTPRNTRPTPGRLPIFAQSSPVTKSPFASLFQAFQTSPVRPSLNRSGMSMTPRRAASSPSEGGLGSSLFTPSPAPASARPIYPAGDPPPSPSPSKMPSPGSTIMLRSRSSTPSGDINELDEARDPPSCLPIASSDDLTDSARTEQSMSSESTTVMNMSKMHDWSSLELPPSSPPPLSSPNLMPKGGGDLPPSDAPSDLSDASPAAFSDANTPVPTETDGQTPSSEGDADVGMDDPTMTLSTGLEYPDSDANALMTDFFSDIGFSDLPEANNDDAPIASAAFDALRNGLYNENFSEAWNLLDNVLIPGQISQSQPQAIDGGTGFDLQLPDWLQATNGDIDFESLLAGQSGGSGGGQAEEKVDSQANLAASNLAELLQGYLV